MRGVASRNRGGQNSSITRRLASAHRPSQRGAVAFTGVLASSASAQAHATASPKQLIRETYLSSGANCGVDRTRNLLTFLQILLPDQADNSRTAAVSSGCCMRLRGALGSVGDGPRVPQLLWMTEIAPTAILPRSRRVQPCDFAVCPESHIETPDKQNVERAVPRLPKA